MFCIFWVQHLVWLCACFPSTGFPITRPNVHNQRDEFPGEHHLGGLSQQWAEQRWFPLGAIYLVGYNLTSDCRYWTGWQHSDDHRAVEEGDAFDDNTLLARACHYRHWYFDWLRDNLDSYQVCWALAMHIVILCYCVTSVYGIWNKHTAQFSHWEETMK